MNPDDTKIKIWTEDSDAMITKTNSYIPNGNRLQAYHNYSYGDLFADGVEQMYYVQALAAGEHNVDVVYVLDGEDLWTETACIATVWIEFADYLTNIRNLTHPGDDYAQYTNCIAIEWQSTPDNKLNLYNLLDITPAYYSSDKITFEIADLIFGSASVDANDYLIYSVSALGKGDIYSFGINAKFDEQVTDRLIVVIYPTATRVAFTNWYADNANMNWLSELPAVYSRLGANNTDPEPSSSNNWYAPKSPHLYYHNDAAFGMRSSETTGGHGHQACYDTNGVLIVSGVSAGSADFSAPWSWSNWSTAHIANDVKPFVWAFQLNGNPVMQTNKGLNTSNPLIIEGSYLEDYFDRRPPHTDEQINPE